ncbi:MAG: hypothetical protein EA419_09025 [Wenzhouxiangella sp.]|nr:MAG: hypothetical protein EA419_09025 [Wenzhouxiangella sp.]
MIFVLVGGVVILASPWIFLYFSPPAEDRRRLRRVNLSVLAIAFTACALLAFWIRQTTTGTADFDWWPAIALTYSALLFPVILLIGGLIRNFVLFRDVR